eukprot:XP_011615106.1 PREDICTED: ankyrin repeat domain-containing protein 53 [Takifugu rubripes]
MATMESSNKSGKKKRVKCKKRKRAHVAPAEMCPAAKSEEKMNITENTKGQPAFHVACLYGQLATIKQLLESSLSLINSSDLQGRRAVHMVMSSQSWPRTSSCLRYLLEQGADINVKTNSGATPLHLAASEGLLDCVETLIQAGADILAQDDMGNTPLDWARMGCHREVARHLRSHMWQEAKKKELQERKLVWDLHRDLTRQVNMNERSKKALSDVKMAEWASRKGFPVKDFSYVVPVSQYHTQCVPSDGTRAEWKPPTHPLKQQPPASNPWTIFAGLPPEKPDLRDSIIMMERSSRQLEYVTKWDRTPHQLPDLPTDVLKRVLFPKAFPSRISSSRHFEPWDITEVQHRRYPLEKNTSPWTEVAMHLAEVLEPGHY